MVASLISVSEVSICKRYGPPDFVNRDHISEGGVTRFVWTLDAWYRVQGVYYGHDFAFP